MKKKSKKIYKPTPEHDSERETRVLLEELGSDVKKIAEQVVSNSEKLKKLDKIEPILAEVSSIKLAVMENRNDIKENQKDIKELKVGQAEIKQKLDKVIVNHEERLQKLEVA